MASNKHHIDSFLKEKMQELPVEFNESHWEDAERRLDEENDDKKKPFPWLFLVGILLIGLGTAAIKQITTKNNTAVKTEEVQQFAPKQSSNSSVVSNNNPVAEPDDWNVQRIESSRNQEMATNPTVNGRGTIITKLKKSDVLNSTISSTQENRIVATNTNDADVNVDNQQSIDGILAQKVDGKITLKPVPKKTIATPRIKKTKRQAMAQANRINEAKDNKVSSQTQTVTAQVHKSQINMTATTQGASVAAPSSHNKPVIYKSVKEFQDLNPRYVKGLENYEYTISTKSLSEAIRDSLRMLANQQAQPQTAESAPKKFKPAQQFTMDRSGFYLLAGIAAARGYKGNSNGNAVYGLSPSLGLGYQYDFSDRMSLYLSAYMSYINHLNIKETSTQVTYSFDKDSTFLSVTRKNLLQLIVPVQFAYKLTPRHSVMGGAGLNIGLNTISLYEDSKQNSATKAFGYTGGLRFLDVNANLGYEYQISNSLALGLFYQQGFRDITKNNYFNNQQTDRNSRGGISLRYKFGR